MSKNEITINEDSFVDRQIVTGDVFMVQSLDGNKLQYDKLSATLDVSGYKPTLFKPRNAAGMLTTENELFGVRPRISILVADAEQYKPGAVVLYKHNGTLVGKYYMDTLERTGKANYKINCISPVGVLSKTKHYGGVYEGIKFGDLINEIVGGVITCNVSLDVSDQLVYGWLPVASRRDNLHQALFAMGAAAQKDENGDLYIAPLFNDSYINIPNSRIYSGGKIKYSQPAAKTSVVEHSYFISPTTESETLFEGAVAADLVVTPDGESVEGTIVLFDHPMHSLSAENGSIISSGANYAVLAPSGACVLTGKKYVHTAREVSVNSNVSSGQNVSVENATLVSLINSENVAQRVSLYRAAAKTLNLSVVVNNEKAGSAVQVQDAIGKSTRGIVSSVDIKISNKLKGDIEVVTDYSPGAAGNFYKNLAVVEESGDWVVPAGVKKIRVVLIGGGNGGFAGEKGEDGASGPEYTSTYAWASGEDYGVSGNGGRGGRGGIAGKIHISTLDVLPGESYSVVIGSGGTGAMFGEEPKEGEASTFGVLTSAKGSNAGSGYSAVIGGDLYALPGVEGLSGGAGQTLKGERPTITYGINTWTAGDKGDFGESQSTNLLSFGGLGGGAAIGANGNDGSDGEDFTTIAKGGEGGSGGTPVKANAATVRGSGGNGGNGGGGGGGGGCAVASKPIGGSGGQGGNGGQGGDGAPGVVLIYY